MAEKTPIVSLGEIQLRRAELKKVLSKVQGERERELLEAELALLQTLQDQKRAVDRESKCSSDV